MTTSAATSRSLRFWCWLTWAASLLTGSGLDVQVVQHRLRHGGATTILDTYGHHLPDSDGSAKDAVAAVPATRGDSSGTAGADLR